MTATPATIWTIILVLGVCTFLIRFSFLGMIGNRKLPVWIERALRYTPVAVMPGLVAPLILWPAATGGTPDPARLAAAAVTVGLGMATRNVVTAVLGGFVVLYLGLWLVG
jgi:branched-subunit amino acid transport protein